MVKKPLRMIEKLYYISSIVIAVIAIGGFILSIYSSRQTSKTVKETSETLQQLNKSLSSFTEPYLDFLKVELIPVNNLLDCQNPPVGIYFQFVNTSNVPIVLKNTRIRLFFGEEEIAKERTSINKNEDESIIPPGKTTGMTIIDSEIKDVLTNKTDILKPPFLRMNFTSTISTFDGSKMYDLNLIYDFGIQCINNYNPINVMKVKTSVISTKK